MFMRTWRGAVRVHDAEEYLQHQAETGVREYRKTPGNLGVLVLRRPLEDLVEVTAISFWTSMDAIKNFAGDNPEQAKFYPGDDDLLAEKDTHAQHFKVVHSDLDPSIGERSNWTHPTPSKHRRRTEFSPRPELDHGRGHCVGDM